jgi:general L-amino acid transport system ATP-binding protein
VTGAVQTGAVRTGPVVSLREVSKWYGTLQVLRDVSLDVEAHERLVICGQSGSGKSTLLRCINGLEAHESGQIVVEGTTLDGARSAETIRRDVGMVFQSFNLFPHLTALENCTLAPIRVRRMPVAEAREVALGYLERVHLGDRAAHYPSELSGGEQQRVAIARALCMAPKVMLFDEPTSALDPLMIGEVLDIIMGLAEAGMTMICVTHEMGFARRLANRMIFMDRGEILEQGPPDDLFSGAKSDRLKGFLARIMHANPPPTR